MLTAEEKKKLFRKLIYLFIFAYLMSNGPGVLLVNKPVLIAGIPILYLWALGWAIVQIALIIYAYYKLWRDETDDETAPGQSQPAGEGETK
jgi:predicted membrane protein